MTDPTPDMAAAERLLAEALAEAQEHGSHSAECLGTDCPVAAELREVAGRMVAYHPALADTLLRGLGAGRGEGGVMNPGGPLQFETPDEGPCAFVVGPDPDPKYRATCKEPRDHYYHSRAAQPAGRFAGKWYSHRYVAPARPGPTDGPRGEEGR